ncbi:MAG: hypothetical protein JRI68_34820, partial [Deltaproteobacteria bacterium]|nr:hypothetical protein [Deltaproteobacteria bacterium]
VALLDLDQAIHNRRAELADESPPVPSYAPVEAPPPDPAALVQRAEERIAMHRRSQRFGEGGEAVPGQGLLGLLGDVGGAAVGTGARRATRGRKGATSFEFDDDSEVAGADTTGKARDLDDLLNARPPKRKQVSGSRSTTGEREKKEEPRRIYRPKKRDERYQARIKAAVVNAGGPPADVMPAIRRHHAQLAACLPSELRDGGLRITIRARIAASGSFRAPQVTAVPALSPDVAACVADVIQRIQLPPQDDSRSVQFSLRFQGS